MKCNKPDSGILKMKNGDEYHGKLDQISQKYVGYSELRYKNGNIYHGDFEDGKFNGSGVYRYKNGNKFTGKYQNGEMIEGEMLYDYEGESYIG
jgi:hypothetical protein